MPNNTPTPGAECPRCQSRPCVCSPEARPASAQDAARAVQDCMRKIIDAIEPPLSEADYDDVAEIITAALTTHGAAERARGRAAQKELGSFTLADCQAVRQQARDMAIEECAVKEGHLKDAEENIAKLRRRVAELEQQRDHDAISSLYRNLAK